MEHYIRWVLETNEEIEICSAHKNIAVKLPVVVMRDGFVVKIVSILPVRYNTVLFYLLCPFYASYVHAASGLLSWNMELSAIASREFSPKVGHLSVLCTRILIYPSSPADRSTLYTLPNTRLNISCQTRQATRLHISCQTRQAQISAKLRSS